MNEILDQMVVIGAGRDGDQLWIKCTVPPGRCISFGKSLLSHVNEWRGKYCVKKGKAANENNKTP
jgi:hypothetical protein